MSPALIIFLVFMIFFGCWIGFAVYARKFKKWSWIISAGGGFLLACNVLALVGSIFIEEKKLPEEIAQQHKEDRIKVIESHFSARDGSHQGLSAYIKSVMNNPNSYEQVATIFRDEGDHLVALTTFLLFAASLNLVYALSGQKESIMSSNHPFYLGIRIVLQPNGNYMLYDKKENLIIEINMQEAEVFEYLKKRSAEFRPWRARSIMVVLKKKFDRITESRESWPSWKEAIKLAYTEGKGNDQNCSKIQEAIDLRLLTEPELAEMYLDWKMDQVPLMERKIVSIDLLSILQESIEQLPLGASDEIYLRELGLKTIGDIVKYSKEELLMKNPSGERHIEALRGALWAYRLLLKGDAPP